MIKRYSALYDRDNIGAMTRRDKMCKSADVRELENELAKGVKERAKLIAENKRLKQALYDIYEVWAGSEGTGQAETAPEQYFIDLCYEMAQIAGPLKEGE